MAQKEESNQEKKKQSLKSLNSYIKHSGLAFQMFGIIGVFTFTGYKIDEHLNNKTPLITATLSLLGVIISLYIVLKGLNKNSN